ncbi:MAG: HNH endonuclease [Candidatus Omnitrophica bacterium]|nr:HNH endonuclease [Candidatus Omnitrophota bacterium]
MTLGIAQRAILAPNASTAHLSTALLDMNLQFMRFVPWQRAMTMYVRGSVNIIQPYMRETESGVREPVFVKTPSYHIFLPFIVTLRQFVYDPYAGYLRSNSPIATKRAILTRDGFQCAYCGERGTTVDHIIPQSKGGGNTWENLITACQACNNRKSDRTPEEAGMKLLFQPETYDGGRSDIEAEIHGYLMVEAGVIY